MQQRFAEGRADRGLRARRTSCAGRRFASCTTPEACALTWVVRMLVMRSRIDAHQPAPACPRVAIELSSVTL